MYLCLRDRGVHADREPNVPSGAGEMPLTRRGDVILCGVEDFVGPERGSFWEAALSRFENYGSATWPARRTHFDVGQLDEARGDRRGASGDRVVARGFGADPLHG